jgi:tetratricopeptide (TPR) repeat protein
MDSFAMKEFKEKGVYGTYKGHFFKFSDQLRDLARTDIENDELQQKVADLEKRSLILENRQVEREIAAVNEKVEDTLRDQAGSELATAMTVIKYEIPRNLSYAQLYALALGYFKAGDYEKSAFILNHLLTLKEEPKFRVPGNFLLSGISWFHLKNYHLAMREVEEAKNDSHPADPVYQSSLLWISMIQKKLDRVATSQETLLKYLELYPHSEEALFLNEGRKPARVSEKSEAAPSAEAESHGKESHHE